MDTLRWDIAEAQARMTVTFGALTALRDLEAHLQPGEEVLETAVCHYAGALSLVAVTDRRVLALRADYSKHQVGSVRLAEIATVDYEPTRHDGFALFTATEHLVARKVQRADGDRMYAALLARAPHVRPHDPSAPDAPVATVSTSGIQITGTRGRIAPASDVDLADDLSDRARRILAGH